METMVIANRNEFPNLEAYRTELNSVLEHIHGDIFLDMQPGDATRYKLLIIQGPEEWVVGSVLSGWVEAVPSHGQIFPSDFQDPHNANTVELLCDLVNQIRGCPSKSYFWRP